MTFEQEMHNFYVALVSEHWFVFFKKAPKEMKAIIFQIVYPGDLELPPMCIMSHQGTKGGPTEVGTALVRKGRRSLHLVARMHLNN